MLKGTRNPAVPWYSSNEPSHRRQHRRQQCSVESGRLVNSSSCAARTRPWRRSVLSAVAMPDLDRRSRGAHSVGLGGDPYHRRLPAILPASLLSHFGLLCMECGTRMWNGNSGPNGRMALVASRDRRSQPYQYTVLNPTTALPNY